MADGGDDACVVVGASAERARLARRQLDLVGIGVVARATIEAG
jgi:hypothetical protein